MSFDRYLARNLKSVQELALNCAKDVFHMLQEGMTEKEAAFLMTKYLEERGVHKFFHRPFAWFGDRTLFNDFSRPLPLLQRKTWKDFQLPGLKVPLPHFGLEFLPTRRKLKHNMPVILDVAPVHNNFFADIGHSAFFGESEKHNSMMKFLDELKHQIPQIVKENRNISNIYDEVDKLLIKAGYNNCHQLYPLGVLGHKVGIYPNLRGIKLPRVNILGFEPEAFAFLIKQNPTAPLKFNEDVPFIAEGIDQNISDGFWAVEPHIGIDSIGGKFEEILVVDGQNVNWLSNLDV
ncbi:MAG: aminopeptidase P family protein [Bacteriovoracaceae bacterium]|nr:aminopeptidase P family protein [Bacteriovoracaceae bacterium]